ncbi:aspartate/glutamate racemase family protein [Paracoccus shanxieyensis]|nr:aspartate/glutamate racemase family protein [Paracoccus shanxieyensis]
MTHGLQFLRAGADAQDLRDLKLGQTTGRTKRGGATPDAVIRKGAGGLIPDFMAQGRALVEQGATALLTSCGFMARHQAVLAAGLGVPFAASSLVQLPLVARTLPQGRVLGVITYDAASLGPEAFLAVGADPATPVVGLPANGAFHGLIEGGQPYDHDAMAAEILAAAHGLIARHPDVGAIVLECTNMPRFSVDLSQALGLPVFDILTLGHWLFSATSPRRFVGQGKG